MGNVKMEKQVCVVTTNQIGEFARLTAILAEADVNISAIGAWGQKDQAFFTLLTNNNAKAIKALKDKGLDAKEQDVVTVMLEDKVGAAQHIAGKIKNAGVNLDSVYGTTCGCKGASALLVLVAKDNAKLAACLK